MSGESAPAVPSARVGFGWCAWHENFARGVRLIQIAEQGSGSGGQRCFACPACRVAYDLVPLADRPL